MGSNITAVFGNCLDYMSSLPENSIDLVLCDLPYGMTRNPWDRPIPFDCLWTAWHRLCKETSPIVLFGMDPFLSDLIQSNRMEFKYEYVWDKHYTRNFLNAKKQPLRRTERIAVFYRKQCLYNPQMRTGICRVKGNSDKSRGCYGKYTPAKVKNDQYYPTDILDFPGVPVNELLHPTQKPVPLLEFLVKAYTNVGGVVLDSCAGVMSTAIACANTGRDCICIENNKEYFDLGTKRLKAQCEPDRINLFFM